MLGDDVGEGEVNGEDVGESDGEGDATWLVEKPKRLITNSPGWKTGIGELVGAAVTTGSELGRTEIAGPGDEGVVDAGGLRATSGWPDERTVGAKLLDATECFPVC